jgi:hypothetical protein
MAWHHGAGREPEIKTQPKPTKHLEAAAPLHDRWGAKRIKHRNREAPTEQRGGKGREGEGWRRRHSLPRAARLQREEEGGCSCWFGTGRAGLGSAPAIFWLPRRVVRVAPPVARRTGEGDEWKEGGKKRGGPEQ